VNQYVQHQVKHLPIHHHGGNLHRHESSYLPELNEKPLKELLVKLPSAKLLNEKPPNVRPVKRHRHVVGWQLAHVQLLNAAHNRRPLHLLQDQPQPHHLHRHQPGAAMVIT
jgi:hypothetical protein